VLQESRGHRCAASVVETTKEMKETHLNGGSCRSTTHFHRVLHWEEEKEVLGLVVAGAECDALHRETS